MFYLCLVLKSNAPPGPINNDINSVKFNEDILDFREQTKLPAVHMYIYILATAKRTRVSNLAAVFCSGSQISTRYIQAGRIVDYIVEIFRLHFTVQTGVNSLYSIMQ